FSKVGYLGGVAGGCFFPFFLGGPDRIGCIRRPHFDKVFPHGAVFICEENPNFWNIPQERQKKRDLLLEKRGGALGLEDVQALVIGATDLEKSRAQWQRLLAPLMPIREGEWQFQEDPTIRLVPHA